MSRSNEQKGQFPEEWLHDFVDGELAPEKVSQLENALERDDALRGRLKEIQETIHVLGSLPQQASPPAAVWEGIRARTQSESSSPVVSISSQKRLRSGIQFSWSQLAAAALVLVVGTGTATWAVANRGTQAPNPVAIGGPTPASFEPGGALPVVDLGEAPAPGEALPLGSGGLFAQFENTAASLEAVVNEGEALLDPETVAVIRSSLATMNVAIDQARTALEADPNSAALNRLLMNSMRKKVELLTEVATRIQAVA